MDRSISAIQSSDDKSVREDASILALTIRPGYCDVNGWHKVAARTRRGVIVDNGVPLHFVGTVAIDPAGSVLGISYEHRHIYGEPRSVPRRKFPKQIGRTRMLRSLPVIVAAVVRYYLSYRTRAPIMAPIKNVAVIGVSSRTVAQHPSV
jgi:hypothetical protein